MYVKCKVVSRHHIKDHGCWSSDVVYKYIILYLPSLQTSKVTDPFFFFWAYLGTYKCLDLVLSTANNE